MIQLHKKGVIILSTYRSGGTQLLNILDMFCSDRGLSYENTGEVDVDIDTQTVRKSSIDQILHNYTEGKFKLILLNNPVVIHDLYVSDTFDRILEEYEVIYLYRKDREKCLLSLGLWERFIKAGLFASSDLWTEENMLEFHNQLIKDPIPFPEVTLGSVDSMYKNKGSLTTLNSKLMQFSSNLTMNKLIADKYKLITLTYEEYESNPETLFSKYFLDTTDRFKDAVKRSYKDKIPYVSSRYRDYYDYTTKRALDDWQI